MRPIAIALAATLAVTSVWNPSAPVVAVLEYPQCADDSVLAVRPLFAQQGNRWIPLINSDSAAPFDLRRVEWTVAFDGRTLGVVRTTDPGFHTDYAWTYPRDRRLNLASASAAPRVANSKHTFGGWCDAPPTRPLVLISAPNYRDPDRWHRFDPPPALRSEVFAEFRKAVGTVTRCEKKSSKVIPFAYSPADLAVRVGYRDRSGRRLVGLQFRDADSDCDELPGAEWGVHWFLLDQGTSYIGADLELVDAGDYDGDGASEILFWYSGYDRDGYELFYEGLQRHADFMWQYH